MNLYASTPFAGRICLEKFTQDDSTENSEEVMSLEDIWTDFVTAWPIYIFGLGLTLVT